MDGDSCAVTVTGEQTDAGDNYTATASSLSKSNYKLPENKTTSFKISKAAFSVKTAPTANTLTYNGKVQYLITVGETNGGTMKYAVTTENQEACDDNTCFPEGFWVF